MKLLLYCTKSAPYLIKSMGGRYLLSSIYDTQIHNMFGNYYNGKVVAECNYELEKIKNKLTNNNSHLELSTDKLTEEELFEKSCLSRYEMFNYLTNGFTKKDKPNGYAIHIKNLHIFDEMMGLSEYNKKIEHKKCDNCEEHCKFYYNKNTMFGITNKGCTEYHPIRKAPQNMCYVYNSFGRRYVLISIRPEWLCKILNREKTIEVRKKVLKEMLNGKQIMG